MPKIRKGPEKSAQGYKQVEGLPGEKWDPVVDKLSSCPWLFLPKESKKAHLVRWSGAREIKTKLGFMNGPCNQT